MQNLLILHGALGAASQFENLVSVLSAYYHVEVIEFEGHGKTPATGSFGIRSFSNQVEHFLQENNWEEPLIFGYSMGGYVALELAARTGIQYKKLVTLGTKLGWNPESSIMEAKQLNPTKIEEKVPAFATYLESLHGKNWKNLVELTASMMLDLGQQPVILPDTVKTINFPVLLMRGGADVMVSEEETRPIVEALPNSSYWEIENWKHPIDRIPIEELALKLVEAYK